VIGMALRRDGAGRPQGYFLTDVGGNVGDVGPNGEAPDFGWDILHPARPIVGIAGVSNSAGCWLVSSDGGVFALGSAIFHGSLGGQPLNQPIVGIAALLG